MLQDDLFDSIEKDSLIAGGSEFLSTLKKTVDDVLNKKHIIEQLEKKLKQEKQALLRMTQHDLPELMHMGNMQAAELSNGTTVTIKDNINCSIPSQSSIAKKRGEDRETLIKKRELAFSALEKLGAKALIKNTLSVPVENNTAQYIALKDELDKLALSYIEEKKVHPQSLKKFIKESLENGDELPLEAFNYYEYKEAKIELPKR